MSSVSADKCSFPKYVAYLLAVLNLIVGIFNFMGMHNYFESRDNFLNNFITGIFSVCLGVLLLYGIVKKHATCVLVYLILSCLSAILETAFIVFLVAEGLSVEATMFCGGLLVFIWAAAYCLYLVYRDLKTKEIEMIARKGQIKSELLYHKGDTPYTMV